MADWFRVRPNLHNDLMLLFEGYTLYYKDAFVGSFLYGWMIVETFLARLWDEYVDSLDRTRKDKDALKDFRSWTSYHYIEMLPVLDFGGSKPITAETRDILNRSRFVHEKKEVDRQEAYDSLDMARKILRNRIEKPDNPFFEL
jgi:hypothetical protein